MSRIFTSNKRYTRILTVGLLMLFSMILIYSCEQELDADKEDDGNGDDTIGIVANVRLEGSVIRWDAIEGATSYQLYRSEAADGTYSQYKDDETITDPQYDLGGELITAQKSYYYKIKACIDDACAELSDTNVLVEPVTAPEVRLEGSVIRWDAIEGATSYQLYRSETADGTYSRYKDDETITDSQYNLSSERFGDQKDYYYKIKACLNEVCTELSDANALVEPATAPEVRLEGSILRWNAVAGATSYQLYRSETLAGIYSQYKDDETITDPQYDLGGERITAQKSYYYKTKACIGDVCTELSNTNALVGPIPAPQVRLEGLILRWDAVDGSSYQIYRSETAEGEYSEYQTTSAITDNQYDLTAAQFSAQKNYYYKVKVCFNEKCTELSDTNALVEPVVITGMALNDYVLTWDTIDDGTYQIQKKKGTSGSYVDLEDTPTIQDTKASLTVDDAYAFYRVKACISQVDQAGDPICTYSAETENTGNLSTICTAKRHEPSSKAALVTLIAAEITNQGQTANLACIDTSAITDMSGLFRDKKTFNGDVSKWDVSSVTNMKDMFHSANAFNGDVSKWDVSSVTDMSYMFNLALEFNSDLSRWDVSSVINMTFMFTFTLKFTGDISMWNVANIAYVDNMFKRSGIESRKPQWYLDFVANQ